MPDNKHTPDIKCYRINYDSKYWANVAAKVGNQCSSPVGAVFAVNALCDAYEDIAKQRDELLAVLEKFIAWNKAYPSSRIYSAPATLVIAKELDQIAEQAEAAIRKLGE